MSPKIIVEVTDDLHDLKMLVSSQSSSDLTFQFHLTHLIIYTFSSLDLQNATLSFLLLLLIASFQFPSLDPLLPYLILEYQIILSSFPSSLFIIIDLNIFYITLIFTLLGLLLYSHF